MSAPTDHRLWMAAVDACRWNSMNPERTAAQFVADFDRHLDDVRERFRSAAGDTETADAEWDAYANGYEARFRAWLATRGRTASVMVTGASNFPGSRNRKAMDSERRRSKELTEWSDREIRRVLKRLTPVRATDPAKELAELEVLLERMKEANKIIRKKWPDDRKLNAMVADVGLKRETAEAALTPDFFGRLGFPPHTLSKVRRRINRLRQDAP